MTRESNHKNDKTVHTKHITGQDSRSALYEALSICKTPERMAAFLTDLCTPGELDALAERWQIARLLDLGTHSYRDISALTGASTTTVGRVARFLQQEPYKGYRYALDKISKK